MNWLSVLSVAFGTFVMVTTEFLPIGLLSHIAQDLQVSEGTAGWMVTVPGMVAAVAAPAAAFGMQRIDRRRMLIVLTCLVTASNLLAVVSHSFGVMLAARLMLGIAVGSFWTFAGAVGRRLVKERDGATATAFVLAGISVGTVLGLPLGTLIGNWAGWRMAFGVGAALSGVSLLAQWLLLPELKPEVSSRRIGLASMAGSPALLAICGFAFLVALGHFAGYTYLEPYLTRQLQLSPNGLSLALCAYGVAGFAGNFVGAHLAERRVQLTFRVVVAVLALSMWLLASVQSSGSALVAVVGWGAAFGATPACIQIWLYRAAPELYESSSALMVTVFQIALAAGAWIGGVTADQLGLPQTMLLGTALAALGLTALLAWRVPLPEQISPA